MTSLDELPELAPYLPDLADMDDLDGLDGMEAALGAQSTTPDVGSGTEPDGEPDPA